MANAICRMITLSEQHDYRPQVAACQARTCGRILTLPRVFSLSSAKRRRGGASSCGLLPSGLRIKFLLSPALLSIIMEGRESVCQFFGAVSRACCPNRHFETFWVSERLAL
jgi:hypothetical protein